MKKVIRIPLHIGDLLAKTHDMDAREFGAHVRLLIAHYQEGEDGITCDERKLARMAGVSLKIWKKVRNEALKGFQLLPHPGGHSGYDRWVHDRCIEEIAEIARRSAINRANALKKDKGSYSNAGRLQ